MSDLFADRNLVAHELGHATALAAAGAEMVLVQPDPAFAADAVVTLAFRGSIRGPERMPGGLNSLTGALSFTVANDDRLEAIGMAEWFIGGAALFPVLRRIETTDDDLDRIEAMTLKPGELALSIRRTALIAAWLDVGPLVDAIVSKPRRGIALRGEALRAATEEGTLMAGILCARPASDFDAAAELLGVMGTVPQPTPAKLLGALMHA